MKTRVSPLMIATAAGTCLALAALTSADVNGTAPRLINISGASLLQNFVSAPASTNDFIDVNGDGIPGNNGPGPQQLAPNNIPGPYSNTHVWTIQYRVTGSVNGLRELIAFGAGNPAVTTDDTDVAGILGNRPPTIVGSATDAFNNSGTRYINGGNSGGIPAAYNQGNPGGAPNRADSNGRVTYSAPPTSSSGSITIDLSPLDVPTEWGVQVAGTGSPFRLPFQAGYGRSTILSVGKDGNPAGGNLSPQLPTIGNRNLFDPANPSLADANTIFSTQIFYAPVAPITNFGTGVTQLTLTELRHLFVTGRTLQGENLVAITRDAGSGTRNAFMNSMGADPSWGRGDNIGPETVLSSQDLVGNNFQPTNKASGSRMLATIINTRLGIGYAGPETGTASGAPNGWLTATGAALDLVSIRNDIYGGTTYNRPYIDTNAANPSPILNNGPEGWVIGGQAILASIGDPLAEPIASGGEGNTTPAMANKAAAAYVNNLRKSIQAFTAVPGGAQTDFSPGEFAAFRFTLLGAIDNLHPLTAPATLVANPGFNLNLQNYTRSNNALNNALYRNTITNSSGRVPARTVGPVYSDGVAGGANYLSQNPVPASAIVSYGSNLTTRNRIAYDFNNDGLRTTADATDIVAAWRARNGTPAAWAPGTGGSTNDAVIEILGDGNNDGNYNAADIRYWADGLAKATATGNINRAAGFTAIDNAYFAAVANNNFFGTTLATSKPYAAGDSRGDVIGSLGRVAPGWAPVGANGTVDCDDIEYVYVQFRKNPGVTDGAATWANLAEAATFDLSADMNGDLIVDQADVTEIIQTILGTVYGDVNFDGVKNATDDALITANFNTLPATYCRGDINGDGVINAADLTFVPPTPCRIDFNNDGARTPADIFAFLNAYFNAGTPVAQVDFNCDLARTPADIFAFLNNYFANNCGFCP